MGHTTAIEMCLCLNQRRSFHVICVSRVNLADTLKNEILKAFFLPQFRFVVVLRALERNRTDQVKCVVYQFGVSLSVDGLANNAKMAGAGKSF